VKLSLEWEANTSLAVVMTYLCTIIPIESGSTFSWGGPFSTETENHTLFNWIGANLENEAYMVRDCVINSKPLPTVGLPPLQDQEHVFILPVTTHHSPR
jgi:hypothetical protein